MDDLVNALIHCLGQINPLYAVLALGAYTIFGDRLKGLFNGLLSRLPKLPTVPAAPANPVAPVNPKTDLDKWLESHPLADRLWVKVKDLFGTVADGKVSEDDAYVKILDALKSVKFDK